MYFAFNLKTKMKYWFYSILLLLSIIRCFIWSVSQCPYIVVLCTGLWSRKSNISSIHLWFIGKVVLTCVGVPIEYRIDHRQQAAAEDVYSVYLLWQHLKRNLCIRSTIPPFLAVEFSGRLAAPMRINISPSLWPVTRREGGAKNIPLIHGKANNIHQWFSKCVFILKQVTSQSLLQTTDPGIASLKSINIFHFLDFVFLTSKVRSNSAPRSTMNALH